MFINNKSRSHQWWKSQVQCLQIKNMVFSYKHYCYIMQLLAKIYKTAKQHMSRDFTYKFS